MIRPRRRRDAVRQPQILATAVEILREKGLSDVRIIDVARRAGISATTVVYYFGSKDQLFAQAIASADSAFYASLEPELDRLDRAIDRVALLIVRSSASDWLLWMDLWVYTRRHPETRAVQRRFHRRWRATIADVLRHGASTGEWGQLDADAAAQRISAATDGLAVHMVLGDRDHTRERYIEMSLITVALEVGRDPAALLAAATRIPPSVEPR